MQTIAVLGAGLMGGSLGLALRKRGVPVRIRTYARRAQTRDAVLALGVADEAFADPADAVRGADLVVLCVPVLTIPELAAACRSGLKPGAVVTDVGSTKAYLEPVMERLLAGSGAVFIGSHPICGSEQQGVEAADAGLYEGAVTVVTPPAGADPAAVRAVRSLWENVGSSVTVMDAAAHDAVLAATSHLPHVAAAALVLAAGDNGLFCGSGFRDTTRIAEGSPEVWSDIVRTNAPALRQALLEFRRNLDDFLMLMDENDGLKLAGWFAAARDKRKELLK